jgi:hypothetical protein
MVYQAVRKKELIKKGLLDKYGKPNENTPKDYLHIMNDVSVKIKAVDAR